MLAPVVQLGRSGLRVSRLCLGTMTFGVTTPPEEAERIAQAALERGVFFWDTADMYGSGASETVVGTLLRGRRSQVVLATKAFADLGRHANDGGLSARHLLAACEDSLRRLGTDWIDLYYLHLPDRHVPEEETLRALEDLVRSGRVRYVACSNHRAWQAVDLVRRAERAGWQPLSAIQPLYNCVNRDAEVELLPMAARLGLGVVTYSPLARGVLTGKYLGAEAHADSRLGRGDPRFLQAEWRPASADMARLLVREAAVRGCTPGQLATAWVLRNRLVHSAIVGPRTLEQALEALGSLDVQIDDAFERSVDHLVPAGCHSGHGFPDPQYAVEGRQPG